MALMKSARSQKGMSFFGWLIVLPALAFAAAAAAKLVPHYLDYMTMKKIIEGASTDKAVKIMDSDDLRTYVLKGMQINNIRDLDLNKALSVTTESNRFLAHLKYEKREPMISNIDVVVNFDHEFSVVHP